MAPVTSRTSDITKNVNKVDAGWRLVIGVCKKNVNSILAASENSEKTIGGFRRQNLHVLAGLGLEIFGVCLAKKGFIAASIFDTHNKSHVGGVANANLLCRDMGEKTIDVSL